MDIYCIKNIEVKSIEELRDKIAECKENGYKPKKSDYFQFLNENMNTIICWSGNCYISIEYIGG